jgi:malonyl-CoA/methylmalonyl-CoA synthetase
MQSNLFNVLIGDRVRAGDGARTALTLDEGASWSYADLDAATSRVAGALRDLGVAAGDRVFVQVGKSAMALAVYLAVFRRGAIYVPLNVDYTAQEVSRFLADGEPALFIARQQTIDAVSQLAPGGFREAISLDYDGSGELARRSLSAQPQVDIAEVTSDSIAAILFTSGTTGRSKGAMLTHGNLEFVARSLCNLWEISSADVLLHALPLFHAHGLFVAANSALHAGARIILQSKFTTEGVLDRLPEATVFMGVPTFYSRLLSNAVFDRDSARNVRLFTSGSAPLSVELFNEFERRTGRAIVERYGMTETTIVSSNPLHGVRLAGTVGYPLPGVEVRLARAESGAGDVGELEVRGPNVFRGYWGMPEQTAQELQVDGFFKTGDVARVDADGRITLVGRSKDMIITGGYNVYPREVEEILCGSAGVREAAVVGVPHPDFGEGVIAIAELEPGAKAPSEGQVLTDAAKVLAKYKVPKRLYFVDALPRNAMGKVLKADLRKTYSTTFSDRS